MAPACLSCLQEQPLPPNLAERVVQQEWMDGYWAADGCDGLGLYFTPEARAAMQAGKPLAALTPDDLTAGVCNPYIVITQAKRRVRGRL